MTRRRFRFGFQLAEGPNAGLRSPGWRVWTHGESTYVTSTSLQGRVKVSLHGDEAWRLAFTSEHARSEESLVPVGLDRAAWEFEPPRFEEGRRLAFAIGVTRGAMLRVPPEAKDEDQIIVPDRWDVLTFAKVWMTEPGIELVGVEDVLGPPQPLTSGRRVWVSADWERVEHTDPAPVPPGALIKPMWPGHDDVSAPGVVLVGMYLG